jgi:hypothetical protein
MAHLQSKVFFQQDGVPPDWDLTVKETLTKLTTKLHNDRITIVSLLYIRILFAKILFDIVVPHSDRFMH